MKKIPLIVISLGILLFCISCKKKNKTGEQPNIIIVMTDDQGYGDLGYHGNTTIKTPALDAFAANAVNFSNYHVGTTCSPTRAGLMTGRNCVRNGVWHTNAGCSLLNQSEVTIADVFSKAGYKTAMFGKWHLGDNYSFLPEQRGFLETFYHKGGGVGQTPDYWGNDYQDDTYFRNGKPEKASGYCTDVFFDEAISFIKKSKDAPFLCYLSLNAPHSPFNVPKEYYALYQDEPELLESQKRFYGMITNIDDNFGKLSKALESLGIVDNTILIFTTDNGTSNGYKFNRKEKKWYGYNASMKGTKTSEYDGGHRVPLIMQWNDGNFNAGKTYEGLSAHVDILPTLASLAGIEFTPQNTLDGINLTSYLKNNKASDRMLVTDTQRNQWPEKGKQSSVMYHSWRLVNGNELYNVTNDPGQEMNIFDKHPKMVTQLQNYYDSWWADASKEFEYSYIDIEPDRINTLTAHDIHVNSITAWHQRDVRKGIAFDTGALSVNFKEAGTYEITLRRWPLETGLPLTAGIDDAVPATRYWDEKKKGKAMVFDAAFIYVNGEAHTLKLNPSDQNARFIIDVAAGKTTMTSGFWLKNGEKTTAFYTDISLKNG